MHSMINTIRSFFLDQRFLLFKGLIGHRLFETIPQIIKSNNKAVVFWTGGKDSNLALYEARALGFDIVCLVKLWNKGSVAEYRSLIDEQASSLNIPYFRSLFLFMRLLVGILFLLALGANAQKIVRTGNIERIGWLNYAGSGFCSVCFPELLAIR